MERLALAINETVINWALLQENDSLSAEELLTFLETWTTSCDTYKEVTTEKQKLLYLSRLVERVEGHCRLGREIEGWEIPEGARTQTREESEAEMDQLLASLSE